MKLQNIYPLSRGGWRTTEWQTYDSEWNAVTLIDVNDTVKINSIVSKIKDKMPTVGNKINVLIDKTSDVPRTKFKEFLTDNGAKKVTLLAKADIVFVRRDTIKYLQNLETKSFQVVPDVEMKKIKNTGKTFYLKSSSSNDQEYFDVEKKCTTLTGQVINGYRNRKIVESVEDANYLSVEIMRDYFFSAFKESTAVTVQVIEKTQLVFAQLKYIELC
jgi:hypothetical protein